jgi:hypothetical protein
MTARDEGRAAARRAEIRKTILQIIDRNGSEPMILLERVLTVVDPLLAECDRRSRAVEALLERFPSNRVLEQMESEGLKLCQASFVPIADVRRMRAAPPAPAAEDGRTP